MARAARVARSRKIRSPSWLIGPESGVFVIHCDAYRNRTGFTAGRRVIVILLLFLPIRDGELGDAGHRHGGHVIAEFLHVLEHDIQLQLEMTLAANSSH